MAEHEGALSGLTVVQIGSGLDSVYAAKLFSDLGARVIVVEPPEGAPLRTRPPVAAGRGTGRSGRTSPRVRSRWSRPTAGTRGECCVRCSLMPMCC